MPISASNAMTVNNSVYKDAAYPSSLYLTANSYATYTNAIEPTTWPVAFTYECMVRPTADNQCVITEVGKGNTNAFVVSIQGRQFQLRQGNIVGGPLGAPVPANTWNHLAIVGDTSANVMRTFVNGVSVGSYSFSQYNFTFSGGTIGVGAIGYTPNCYIGGIRMIIGACLYTSNFTVPSDKLFAV